jgi:hypothetical protein
MIVDASTGTGICMILREHRNPHEYYLTLAGAGAPGRRFPVIYTITHTINAKPVFYPVIHEDT